MASDRFVALPASAMFAFLVSKGFTEAQRSMREVVYERAHHRDPRYKVLIYTSIARGRMLARSRGADAIRIVAIFDDGARRYPVAKIPKVLRTAPPGEPDARVQHILERVLTRAREAYAVINIRLTIQ